MVVLLFTCFPAAYAQASVALFWPLHAVLLGIVLRGAAFVFRAYAAGSDATRDAWGSVFGGVQRADADPARDVPRRAVDRRSRIAGSIRSRSRPASSRC